MNLCNNIEAFNIDCNGEPIIKSLKPNQVFVFGSNLLGIHGAGAAKVALDFGAKHRIGQGISGQTYAIPTKHNPKERLPLSVIAVYISEFIRYAKRHTTFEFLVTPIGCGLAGYNPQNIAPLFTAAQYESNIILPLIFKSVLNENLQNR